MKSRERKRLRMERQRQWEKFKEERREAKKHAPKDVAKSERGVIVLHDASRKEYRKTLEPFIQILKEDRDTMVFKPSRFIRFREK